VVPTGELDESAVAGTAVATDDALPPDDEDDDADARNGSGTTPRA
jgi:hypothetical protein